MPSPRSLRGGDALFRTGAYSLSDHIALHEAGLTFEHAKVDLKAKKTDSGEDFLAINPKGYVPALTLDSGETITELLWARKNGIEAPARLVALRDRMMERPAVRKAMTHEGLIKA